MQKLKRWLINKMIEHLAGPIQPFHVLTVDKSGKMWLGKEEVTDEMHRQLRAEARAIKNFKLWQIFQETVRYKATEKALIESTSWEHVEFSKAMLHNLGIIASIVRECEREKK